MVATVSSFRWVFLPYCLIRQEDGSYVITNRRYKPLGMTSTGHVDYAAHPVRVKFKRLTALTARKLDYKGRDDLDRIYLYNDGCLPTDSQAHWDAYAKRLHTLAKLQVVHLEE